MFSLKTPAICYRSQTEGPVMELGSLDFFCWVSTQTTCTEVNIWLSTILPMPTAISIKTIILGSYAKNKRFRRSRWSWWKDLLCCECTNSSLLVFMAHAFKFAGLWSKQRPVGNPTRTYPLKYPFLIYSGRGNMSTHERKLCLSSHFPLLHPSHPVCNTMFCMLLLHNAMRQTI